jgi:phage-related tail protein
MPQDTILQQSIIEKLGLQNLPKEKQEEILVKMTEVLLKKIYLETFEKLADPDREELAKMLDTEEAEPEKVEAYLRTKIEDYDGFVKKIVEDFTEEMKKTTGDLGKIKEEELAKAGVEV